MAAQIVFIGNKEYKVVNWIDGAVHITTFSAAGKESAVRSEKTKARVMAALVEKAHDEAIEVDEAVEWEKITPQQRAIHASRVVYGLLMKDKHRIDNAVDACHAEALESQAETVASIAVINDKALNAYWLDCESMKIVVAYREWQAMRDEALAMNSAFDEGCELVRADVVQQGDVLRDVDDRNVTVDMIRRVSNAVEMHIKGLWRIAYPHTIVKRVRPLPPVPEIIDKDECTAQSCGFDCNPQVKADLISHYKAIREEIGGQWSIRVWHNSGWHAELVNEVSGFHLCDQAMRGGVSGTKYNPERYAGDRYYCYNYSDREYTTQVRGYGFTPIGALSDCVHTMMCRRGAYDKLANDLKESTTWKD